MELMLKISVLNVTGDSFITPFHVDALRVHEIVTVAMGNNVRHVLADMA